VNKKQRSRYSREEKAAFHESGHVVAAFHLRLTIKSVSLDGDGDSYGRVLFRTLKNFRPDLDLTLRQKDWMERHIMCWFAGALR